MYHDRVCIHSIHLVMEKGRHSRAQRLGARRVRPALRSSAAAWNNRVHTSCSPHPANIHTDTCGRAGVSSDLRLALAVMGTHPHYLIAVVTASQRPLATFYGPC